MLRGWMPHPESDRLLDQLLTVLPWSQHTVSLFGRQVPAPRLSCWIGDPHAAYRYSGKTYSPVSWPDSLASLRRRLELACGASFDSVLANLYRNGQDSMGWHADDEPELGREPVIASLSLGDTRTMRFRSGQHGVRAGVELEHGDLLVMRGRTQQNYQHAVPKTKRPRGPRINLTFRRIVGTDRTDPRRDVQTGTHDPLRRHSVA